MTSIQSILNCFDGFKEQIMSMQGFHPIYFSKICSWTADFTEMEVL